MRIVLLGPPGAGKGTQAARIAQRFRIPHISTGDMMRAAIQSGSDLGRKAKAFVEAGKLVPDEVLIDVVRERLGRGDCASGFLLDGFPRTRAQAEALDRLSSEIGCALSHVVEIRVAADLLKDRLLKRGQIEGRADDTAEVIEKRLMVYEEQTRPVSSFYAGKGTLVQVDGVGTVDEVEERLVKALKKR
ncbi:MAG: adenylate kinase [Planctomycetes bacterium]|nr:adenylate kinase [Planctomycetota bacterium]